MARKPIIGLITDVVPMKSQNAHLVYEKYIYAVAVGAQATTVLIPGRLSDVDGTPSAEEIDFA